MDNKIRHLEPYGFDTDNVLKPNNCGNISITITGNADKDKAQDDEISKKANASDVNDAFKKVSDALNLNGSAISALTEHVDEIHNSLEDNNKVDDEQSIKIDELSGKVDSCVTVSSMTNAIESVISEKSYTKDEADGKFATIESTYTKENADEKFATKEELDTVDGNHYTKDDADHKFAKLNDLNTTKKSFNEFKLQSEKSEEEQNKSLSKLNETVSSNTNSIDGLRKNKLDASTFSNYTSNMSPIILKLSQGVSKNENDISGKADKADVETMEKKLTALVGENTSNIKLKADKDFVSDEDDKLRLAIGKNQDAITDLSKSVNSKADKESVDDLSSTVSAMTSYIKASITNSATNRDLKTVSDKVDDLSYLVANKATLADFNIVSATSKSNSVAIDDLKHDKQERGNYVSATTMLNYYTKSETSGNTQIQDALDDKQDKGNYVEFTDLDNYYTKSETIDAYEFKGFSAKVTTDLETKANKDAVAQLSRNVDNCQNDIEKALNDLTLLDNDMHTKYTTKSYVDNTVDAVSSGVSENSNLISKISNINNLKLYDPTKGSFIDDGNGLLDVLHRKFHLLIKGIDETNTSIEGYLCNLEKRIRAIEDKNK